MTYNKIITQENINQMKQMLKDDNRTGVYLKYFELTGSNQALTEAKISTFSGFYGGVAELANENIKDLYPVEYNIEVDQFSREITTRFIEDLQNSLQDNGNGYLTDDEIQYSARSVWEDKGLGDQFPGNIQNLDTAFSSGTWFAVKNFFKEVLTFGLLSDGEPIRPEDFNSKVLYDNDYEIREISHNGETISYLANKDTGKVMHVWGNQVSEDFKYTKLLLERGNLNEGEFHYISGRTFTFSEGDDFLYGDIDFPTQIKTLPSIVVKIGGKLVNIDVPEEMINSDGTISKDNVIKLSSEFAENNDIENYSLNIRDDKNIDISVNSGSVKIDNFDQLDNLSKITLVKELNLINKTITFKNPDGSFESFRIDDALVEVANQNNLDLESLAIAAANGQPYSLEDRQVIADNGGAMYVYRTDEELKITHTDNDFNYVSILPEHKQLEYLSDLFVGVNIVKSYKVSPGDTLSSLAEKFGTTVPRLQELNNIDNPDQIDANQVIRYDDFEIQNKLKVNHKIVERTDGDTGVLLADSGLVATDAVYVDSDGNPTSMYVVEDGNGNKQTIKQEGVTVEGIDGKQHDVDSLVEMDQTAGQYLKQFADSITNYLTKPFQDASNLAYMATSIVGELARGGDLDDVIERIAIQEYVAKPLTTMGVEYVTNQLNLNFTQTEVKQLIDFHNGVETTIPDSLSNKILKAEGMKAGVQALVTFAVTAIIYKCERIRID